MKQSARLYRLKNFWKVRRCLERSLSSDSMPSQRKIEIKTPLRHQLTSIEIPVYGGRYLVSMLVGVGLGPQLMGHVQDVFRHASIPVDFEYLEIKSMKDVEEAIVSIKRNGTAIKSTFGDLGIKAGLAPNVAMRQALDLYLNMVHCKPYCGLSKAKFTDVDVILMRQNTEGEYAMLEHESVNGVVESLKIITRANSERFARRTFEYASVHNRKKVTVVHKANIMKMSDGLFLGQARAMAKNFSTVKQEHMLIDNCCMQIVNNPKQFDILMMPNLYGSIVINLLCGILGGPGLFAGCNYGEYHAVFEPATRNMGLDIVGKNKANPVAMLNASVELLYHLGLSKEAHLLDKAIYKTICKDMVHTPDLGGTHTSTDVVEKIKENINFLQL